MSLSKEIYLEIFSYLPQHHLRPVLRTCRTFARLVKPLMFKTLHLDGDAQPGIVVAEWKPEAVWSHEVVCPGRTRTAELASLEDTVEELVALDILQHVHKLKFSPRYYVEGFWTSYRQWLGIAQDVEEDFHSMFEVDDYESDDGEYRGIRRLAAARLARPGEEHELIVKAESIWARKVTQQCEKAGTNLSALVKLFTHMPNLKDIEIREWSCDLAQYGFKGSMGREVGQQFAGCSTTWKHLELLSAAVQKANIHIASLFTPKINLFTLTTNGALESLFSSITALSFNVENADLLRAAPNNEPSPFAALLRQTSRTLEVLEFRNLTTSHPQIPNAGDILLSRIFGESHEAGSPDNTVPVFSRLKTLKLRSLYLSVPYLIDFVSQQPKLQYAHFDYVYLTPEGYKWSHVAERLPPSCKKLCIGNCGHDKFDPNTPTVDGHIKSFLPYKEGFPATSDWQVDESFVEQKMDNDEQAQKNSGWHMAPGPPGAPPGSRGLYRTTTREELRAKYRMAYSCAVFRRK